MDGDNHDHPTSIYGLVKLCRNPNCIMVQNILTMVQNTLKGLCKTRIILSEASRISLQDLHQETRLCFFCPGTDVLHKYTHKLHIYPLIQQRIYINVLTLGLCLNLSTGLNIVLYHRFYRKHFSTCQQDSLFLVLIGQERISLNHAPSFQGKAV